MSGRVKVDKNKDALRITNQFRAKRSMVYDLKCHEARLTVTVSPRENEGDIGEWKVEACTGAPPAAVIAEWGATRAEALAGVGRAWATKSELEGLPPFDWDAVAQVLTAVRAL